MYGVSVEGNDTNGSTAKCREMGTCVSANAVSTPEKNPHRQECAEETCTSTAARDRYTTSPALCHVSLGKGQTGVLRALFLSAYYSPDVKRLLLNFSVLI